MPVNVNYLALIYSPVMRTVPMMCQSPCAKLITIIHSSLLYSRLSLVKFSSVEYISRVFVHSLPERSNLFVSRQMSRLVQVKLPLVLASTVLGGGNLFSLVFAL